MKNLTIKLKLTFTFLIIGILVAVLAIYSIISISKVSYGFNQFREMSKDTVLAAQVQSDMLLVRMSVKDYILNPSEEEILKFNQYFDKVNQSIDLANVGIKKPLRLELMKELKVNVSKYKSSFFLISSINQERDDIINENLESNTVRIEEFLTNVLNSLKEDKNLEEAFKIAQSITKLQLARMYTAKFLNTYSKDNLDNVNQVFKGLAEQLDGVENLIENSSIKSQLGVAKRFIKIYQNGIDRIEEIISERNQVLENDLNKTGLIIDKLADDIKLSIKKDQETIGLEVASLNENIQNLTITISLFILIFIIVLSFLIPRNISRLIDTFQLGLMNFFKYLNKESNTTELIPIDSQDEIGIMSKIVNQNISKTKFLIDQDIALIEDVKRVVMLVKEGKIKQEVIKSTDNEGLEELKKIFNEMLDVMATNVTEDLNTISQALNSYQKLDFTYIIQNQTGKTAEGLNTLAKIINEMLRDNKSNGLALDNNSDILLKNVDTLNKNAIQAAASLEETSAALDEITNNIKNNTNNVVKMASYIDEITISAKDGELLSNQTISAMNDINKEVSAIKDAISVIDQIAFQTNILSLNAAVEAATAGESGRGFAVVAQEVRNLATRSAEAAKEIKSLVENATNKADTGKIIATKMIAGYTGLNENISKTIGLILNIEDTSKEQQSGIEQINDVVSILDQQTQENSFITNRTYTIAVETDTISKLIVSKADEKEFIGKEDIKAKVS
jgi:methyl-accepting chemotaxis protein